MGCKKVVFTISMLDNDVPNDLLQLQTTTEQKLSTAKYEQMQKIGVVVMDTNAPNVVN